MPAVVNWGAHGKAETAWSTETRTVGGRGTREKAGQSETMCILSNTPMWARSLALQRSCIWCPSLIGWIQSRDALEKGREPIRGFPPCFPTD